MIEVPGLKIESPLGKGGTAAVAKAFSEELHKFVALKYPLSNNAETSNQFVKLASREFHLIGNSRFPGLVKILKNSTSPAFLLLELCDGQSLDKTGKIESSEMLLQIICSIAANMEFLRLNKIIHCDLKPHNVFLPSDFPLYEKGHLFFTKISDFSLGRFENEPESSRAGHGTVGYAAPETLALGKSSYRSDLFSLGVIAYQLATGIHPFAENETDPVKIEGRIQEDEPVPIFQFRTDLPKEFIEIISALIAKVDSDRPENAWQVCQSLKEGGCQYPFEKVLSPHFLMMSIKSYDEITGNYLELTTKEKRHLDSITDGIPENLRLVLTSNYRKETLQYNGEKYEFRTGIYWPSLLRRKVISFYSDASIGKKKSMVSSIFSSANDGDNKFPPGTKVLFPQFLSTRMVQRLSKKAAAKFGKAKNWQESAKFHLMAGQLKESIRFTDKSLKELDDAESRANAIHLINKVNEYAVFLEKEFDVRQLLMAKGDIERVGGDIESSLNTYNKIIGLYDNVPPDKLLAETYRDMGDLYKSKQKVQQGIEVLNKALDVYKGLKDDLEMSRALNNLGELYRIATDLPNSLKFMRQALAIQRRMKDTAAVANSLNNIAITFGMKGRLKRAIAILSISLKMKRTIDDKGEIARTLNNLGYAHQLDGDSVKAEGYLKESLEINRTIGSKKEILSNLWNLSEIMMKAGQLKDALGYVKDGLDLSATLSMKPQQAHFNKSMGDICLHMCRFSETAACYEKASALAAEIDDKVLQVRLKLGNSELRSAIGDFKAAIHLAEQSLTDSTALKARLEEFHALLILVRLTGKIEHLNHAKSIADTLKLKRERIILDFVYLQYLLDMDAKNDLKRIYDIQKPNLDRFKNDAEFPELLNIASEIEIVCGDKGQAAEFIQDSKRLAHSRNLVFEEINSHILAARIAFENVDFEKSFASCKSALQLCKETAMTISADSDKQLFMKKPKVQYLANLIKKLNEKIGPKQKAGAMTPAPEVN